MGLFTQLPDVEIAAICDPDLNLIPAMLKQLPEKHTQARDCARHARFLKIARSTPSPTRQLPITGTRFGAILGFAVGGSTFTPKNH
jgi:hypothetical protein